ncbi:MAG: polysaccharide deacetylase family protein [Burkholderiales bacterium]|nr:polysaccharide deacetylase family protein [Burkholderiales bacterium]
MNGSAFRLWCSSLAAALVLLLPAALQACRAAEPAATLTILAYHRFGPAVADSMTVRTATFEAQLHFLRARGYAIVPLRRLIRARQDRTALPAKLVALSVDDGHRTVYTDLLPVVLREKIPVTLFIYPSAISNAAYAMSWQQLAELHDTGLFDIQAHTYWHPNFKTEKRRLTPDAYARFVQLQLEKPRQVLRQKLGVEADLLAWPFGIYDEELMAAAHAAGYLAAFSIDARQVSMDDELLALPRFLMLDSLGVAGLAHRLGETIK